MSVPTNTNFVYIVYMITVNCVIYAPCYIISPWKPRVAIVCELLIISPSLHQSCMP